MRVETADHVKFTFGDTTSVYNIPYLIFADDLVILAHSVEDLEAALINLSQVSALLGVNMSLEKTKIVWLAGRPASLMQQVGELSDDEKNMQVESNVIVIPDFSKDVGEMGRIEIVDEFEYLDNLFTSNPAAACRQTIYGAIKRSKKAMSALRQLFRSRKLSRKLKTEFVLKCVFPALFYGCKTWPRG